MKVLFLTYSPSPYRMDFFNEMGKYCDLTVTFENEGTSNRNKNWFNRTASSFNPVFLQGKKLKNGNTFNPEVTKVIRKGYDRIIVSNYSTPTSMYAIEYLRFHHIPFWLEADGGMIANENKLKYLVKKHFISSASHWFSSGKVTSEYFVHYGANPEEIYVYPFTSLRESDILKEVPSEEEKMEIRRKLGIGGGGGKVILTVGRFTYENGYGKGYDILLKMMSMCPDDYHLYIVGDQPTDEFINMRSSLGVNDKVHFIGYKNKNELKEYYLASDLFCLQTRGDVWGLVINEAMSIGLPVIASDKCVAGLELIEDDVNGYVVPVEDVHLLNKRVETILQNEELCKQMGQHSLSKIHHYTIEEMAQKHIVALKTSR